MTDERSGNWLERSLRSASAEVATWPEWKKKAMRVLDLPRLETPMIDLRAERVASAPKIKMTGKRPVVRDPSTVTGICLHQTAVEYGVSAAQLRAAGGDRRLALARRALNVACHAMAFRDGFFVVSTPLPWYVNHGNGLNATRLGLEIDGRYPGRPDDPRTTPRREDLESTWGGEPSEITPALIAAARSALRWLVEA